MGEATQSFAGLGYTQIACFSIPLLRNPSVWLQSYDLELSQFHRIIRLCKGHRALRKSGVDSSLEEFSCSIDIAPGAFLLSLGMQRLQALLICGRKRCRQCLGRTDRLDWRAGYYEYGPSSARTFPSISIRLTEKFDRPSLPAGKIISSSVRRPVPPTKTPEL